MTEKLTWWCGRSECAVARRLLPEVVDWRRGLLIGLKRCLRTIQTHELLQWCRGIQCGRSKRWCLRIHRGNARLLGHEGGWVLERVEGRSRLKPRRRSARITSILPSLPALPATVPRSREDTSTDKRLRWTMSQTDLISTPYHKQTEVTRI